MDAVHARRDRAACTSWARTRRCRTPTSQHAREALADARLPGRAGHLPHRDRVPRRRDPAGHGVPGEDRHVHQHRPPGAARAPGARRRRARRGQDLWIIQEIARRMGLDWNYAGPRDVFEEMRLAMPSIAGITWERLERESRGHLSVRERGRPRRAGRVHRQLPDRHRARAHSCRPTSFPAAEQPDARIPDGADHRPPARALAHRQHDAARRACSTRSSRSRWRSLHPLDLAGDRRRARAT